jgi:type IV secretion system protein VirD4
VSNTNDGILEQLVIVAVVAAAALSAIVWGGAALAAFVGGQSLGAGWGDALRATLKLPGTAGDPGAAWPAAQGSALPGPVMYWLCTAVVVAVAAGVAAGGVRVWHRLWRPGTDVRDRLGVNARAWMARTKDLRTLFVRGPEEGRFILGRFGGFGPFRGHLVATECRATAKSRRRRSVRRRQGDTGAVALVGPSRSGKTVAAVAGTLEWDGPAILSSVKSDLLEATIGWRSTLGEVRVYDPLALTACSGAGWSPLANAETISGARRAARNVLEALQDDGTENLGMWKNLAEYLLSGLFWLAQHSGRDMSTVVEWTLTQDRPRPDAPSEVDALLREQLAARDPQVADDAVRALQYLLSVWQQDERPRSSVYVTAQAALGAFADPAIAAATRTNQIDIDWLLSGNNTLYVCSPLKDQQRLAPAFGGLVDDMMTQCYERANRRPDGRLERLLLVVLDEAGNQRLEQLPNYASTVAGLGVQLVTIWQSMAQITRAYGKGAGILLTNHLSKVFYTGLSDEDTLSYVAKVVGEEEVDARQLGGNPTALLRSNVTDSTNRVSLVQSHCLRQMVPGDALLLHGTLPPAHITTRRYFKEPVLRDRAAMSPPDALRRPTRGGTDSAAGARPLHGGDGTLDDLSVIDAFADERAEVVRQLELLAATGATTQATTQPGE